MEQQLPVSALPEWGLYGWASVAEIGTFTIFAFGLLVYMVKARVLNDWFYLYPLGLTIWVWLGNALHFYIAQEESIAHTLASPTMQLLKDSSGMAIICMWSWISASQLKGLGASDSWRLMRVMKHSVPVFLLFLVAAAVALFTPIISGDVIPPSNVDTSHRGSAIIYRWLIALPIAAFAAMMIIETLKFFVTQDTARLQISDRLLYFSGAWAGGIAWAGFYTGLFMPVGGGATVSQMVSLTIACGFGLLAMKVPAGQSGTDLGMEKFDHDQRRTSDTAYRREGFRGDHTVRWWDEMEGYVRYLAWFLGPSYMSSAQLASATNALFLADSRADLENARDIYAWSPSSVAEFRPSIYEIPEDSPARAEIEEEIENHRRACYVADLLCSKHLARKLAKEPLWVQVTAVAACEGEIVSAADRKEILDPHTSPVDERILEIHKGIKYKSDEREGESISP